MSQPHIGFKLCQDDRIGTLLITGRTNENRRNVVDPRYAKFRTTEAHVLDITDSPLYRPFGQPERHFIEAASMYDIRNKLSYALGQSDFMYRLGETVRVSDAEFDSVSNNKVCGPGIHYYLDKDAAIMHERVSMLWLEKRGFTGTIYRFANNGTKLSETPYIDGRRNGIAREFYKTPNCRRHRIKETHFLNGYEPMYDAPIRNRHRRSKK